MFAAQDQSFVGFTIALADLQTGYYTGLFRDRHYGVSIERPVGGRITKLYAQELGGTDIVSFNLFMVGEDKNVLRPCEMSSEKVIDFVLQFAPD